MDIILAKHNLGTEESMTLAYRLMIALNKSAWDVLAKYRVHACIDVTGVSLLGHLLEMAQGSGMGALLQVDRIEPISEALELVKIGVLLQGTYRNHSFAEPYVDAGDTPLHVQDVLYDPQTAGGLLTAVDSADAEAVLSEPAACVPSGDRGDPSLSVRGAHPATIEPSLQHRTGWLHTAVRLQGRSADQV